MAYKHFSTTKATALSSALASGDVTIPVTDGSTYPDPAVGGNGPYTILLAYGSDREEVVTVTAKPTANSFTVTRGEDGSTATAKNLGDVVVHGVSKRDWDDLPTPSEVTAEVTAAVTAAMPVGAIVAYGGTAAPGNWHLCDGTAHGSAALLALLGSANTPNLRDRFIVGAGTTYADKATGGAATHTLSVGEMPSHDHGGVTGAMSANATHTHALPRNTDGGGATGATVFDTAPIGDFSTLESTAAANVDHTHSVTAQGGGAAHNNLPPYYALTYIIKKA